MNLLSAQQLDRITDAVQDLTPAQLAWVGGYLSGLSMGSNNIIPFPTVAAANQLEAPIAPIIHTTVLYGSQTGNSKKIAESLAQHLQTEGLACQVKNLAAYRPQQLKKEQRVIFVISTHGNGEPPDEARPFFQFIQSARAPQLTQLEYAVLALGDASYEQFCQTGIELEQRLQALGAKTWFERIDCDVDFAETASQWQQQVLEKLKQEYSPVTATPASKIPLLTPLQADTCQAELLASLPVTDTDSAKQVLHLEFALADNIAYQPGDIAAVKIQNEDALVNAMLAQAQLAPETEVTLKNQRLSLREALLHHVELTQVTRKQLQHYAEQTHCTELKTLAADKNALVDWLYAADWLDVLQQYPAPLSAQALVDLLRPLKAREYSIASSPTAHPDELHLLVKRVEYLHQQRLHLGAGSNCLARLVAGESVSLTVKANLHFKLPPASDTKIIMIGAGTGVAPFRSFLCEREAQGLQGNTWLFFGEQHFRSDFLYQSEWLNHLKSGVLERMNVAFSRDQAEKIYVQHRLYENAADVWQWLQEGAHLYVCGDMHKMAKDVHNTLIQIAVEQGGYPNEQATQWLEQLISERRYQRDVY